MHVYSINACISTPERIANTLNELSTLRWDAVCFSETRATSKDVSLMYKHRLILHRGTEHGGIGLLLNSNFEATVVAKKSVGNRIFGVKQNTDTNT